MIEVHRVERPAGSFFFGQWLIDASGRRVARTALAHDASARVIVNGGNCNWPDINWVHYVHHAWRDVGAVVLRCCRPSSGSTSPSHCSAKDGRWLRRALSSRILIARAAI